QIEATQDEAIGAIQTAIADRKDEEMRTGIITRMDLPWNMSPDNRQAAIRAAREAIEQLPRGIDRREVEEVCEQIARTLTEAHEKQEHKEHLIHRAQQKIFPFLLELSDDLDFDAPLSSVERDLQGPIREALDDELDGTESDVEVARLVRRLVR